MTTLSENLISAGHFCDVKSPVYKELNSLIETGILSVQVARRGNYLYANGSPVSVYLIAGGKAKAYTLDNKKEVLDEVKIGGMVARMLSNDNIKEAIKLKHAGVSLDTRCFKCNGTGYLYQFKHVCNGVCFGCMGTGYKLTK